MKTLVLANQKGGVGKSAVATLLAHLFRQRGLRVLAIDLEHQGNFSEPVRKSQRAVRAEVPASGVLVQRNPVIPAADCVLSPIQLNQEAMDGVSALLNHPKVGVRRIQAVLNPKLHLIGLYPTMVEATPLQRENFMQLLQKYSPILIPIGSRPGEIASMPRRSAIAEAQAEGFVLWEMKKTAARDAWREIEPGLTFIANTVLSPNPRPTVNYPLNGASHGPVAR